MEKINEPQYNELSTVQLQIIRFNYTNEMEFLK